MQRRSLGQLEVSAVGLGCGTMTPFYGEPDRAAGIATIRRAREIGVDLLDTADGYGRGRNEELVAEAVREHRGDFVIASSSPERFVRVTGGHVETIDSGSRSFQPMNVNFGLFPPLGGRAHRSTQKQALCARALADLETWIGERIPHAAEEDA